MPEAAVTAFTVALVLAGALFVFAVYRMLQKRARRSIQLLDKEMKEAVERVAGPTLGRLDRLLEATGKPLTHASQALALGVERLEKLAAETETRAVVREEISRAEERAEGFPMGTPSYSAMESPAVGEPDVLGAARTLKPDVGWEEARPRPTQAQELLTPELAKSAGLHLCPRDGAFVARNHGRVRSDDTE